MRGVENDSPIGSAANASSRFRVWLLPFAAYIFSLAIVALGGAVGIFDVIGPGVVRPSSAPAGYRAYQRCLVCFRYANGSWHISIARRGYEYQPGERSNVAFFPIYPLLIRVTASTLPVRSEIAALLVSTIAGLLATWIVGKYLNLRAASERAVRMGLFAFLLFPTTFFFRFGYNEYVFICLCAATFIGFQKDWPPLVIAAVVGLATATRPVGVALLVPLFVHLAKLWAQRRIALSTTLASAALGCSGLLAFMGYLFYRFGDPLVFATTQENWSWRGPHSTSEKLFALLTFEPFFATYDSNSRAYWQLFSEGVPATISLQFANPLWFLFVALLVYVGWVSRTFTRYETIYSIAVLSIPYFTRSYEMCMAGQGRFAAVALPVYLILGNILAKAPYGSGIFVLGFMAFYLFVYSAIFCANFTCV